MADSKTTDTNAAPAAVKPGSLSAEAAYAAAATAIKVEAQPVDAAQKPVTNAAPATVAVETAAPAAKPAVAATAVVTKAAAEPAAKPKIKKIVDKGTKKMATTKTTATKRVVKETKDVNDKAIKGAKNMADKLAARLEKLTADAQARAKEVADRAVALSKDAVEFNRENLETLIESGKITAKGAQEIGKTNIKYGRENLTEANRAFQNLFSGAAPKELLEKQADFLRSGLDRMMDQTSNNADAVTKLAGKAYQPIADRVSTIRKNMQKAA